MMQLQASQQRFGGSRLPGLSLRGAKRRGNLGKAAAISPMAFPHSDRVLRDCTPRALPRASRSGRHVGRWPPRNDKSEAFAILTVACTDCKCAAGPGCPLPYNGGCDQRDCLPEIAPQGHFLALRAQGATAPSGPRNDTSGAITILTPACPPPLHYFYHAIIVSIDDILVSLKITIGFFRFFPV